jgi:hypothetical protein
MLWRMRWTLPHPPFAPLHLWRVWWALTQAFILPIVAIAHAVVLLFVVVTHALKLAALPFVKAVA